MLCAGNGRENLPPGCVEPDEIDEMFVPEPCCKYCNSYNGDYCTKDWNNMDESYCIPERDEKDEFDSCDDYEWNGEPSEEPEKPAKPDPARYKGREWMLRVAEREWERKMILYREYMNKLRKSRGDEE